MLENHSAGPTKEKEEIIELANFNAPVAVSWEGPL